MAKPGEILVLRGGGLGDTLLALPAVRALRRRFAPCRIEWVGNPSFLPVIRLGLRVERLRSADGPEMAWLRRADAGEGEVLRAFGRRGPFDLLVGWTPGDKSFEKRLRALAERVLRADPRPPRASPPLHAADYLIQCLEPLGVESPTAEACAPEVRPTPGGIREGRALLSGSGIDADSPFFVFHPGSGGRWKCWPPACFARLGESLTSEGEILWVTGPADASVLEEVRSLTRGRSLRVVESPPLPALAGALRRARGYVGNDSGVTHLAAACGARTVALFGPTDPAVWGPRGRDVVTLRRRAGCRACARGAASGHECLGAIGVEEVLEAVLGFG